MQGSAITSVSDFLQRELSKRCDKNASYSLRAFARDLEISPSRLSEILKHDQGLSTDRALALAEKLKLKTRKRDLWLTLNQAQHGRSPKAREVAKRRLLELRDAEKTRKLREDQFQVISEWYHGALMELPQTKSFRNDPEWMAAQLGIRVEQVELGIERLLKLRLLAKNESGQLVSPTEASEVMTDVPSAAIRKAHRQLLQRATDSLLKDPMKTREFNSMLIAIPTSELPRFQSEIQQFMNKFYQRIGDQDKDAVYALSVQLFPVQQIQGNK